jgi:hypothetical protein
MSRPVRFLATLMGLSFLAPAAAGQPSRAMLGRWDVTVTGPQSRFPSWFELCDTGAGTAMRMVYVVGGVRDVPYCEIGDGTLRFVVPTWNDPYWRGPTFQGRFNGRFFTGTAQVGDQTLQWTAVRAPRLERRMPPRWGEPVALFDGVDLRHWVHRTEGHPPCWLVRDGTLEVHPPCDDLVSRERFTDFQLHAEFRVEPGGDSGVWLRGRYEIQIRDGVGAESPSGATGSIYRFLAPSADVARAAREWQDLDATLIGRRVTVALNGTTIIDDEEIPGITGGALDSDEGEPGPIMLQGTEGEVWFRNIVVTPVR